MQDKFGAPCAKCSECDYGVAVDLNTPCELDPAFNENIMIIIEPQSELPAKDNIIAMAKAFGLNALQMRKNLLEGFSTEVGYEKAEVIFRELKVNRIAYKTEGYVDLRKKYPFYAKCGYPYSRMDYYLRKDEEYESRGEGSSD